MSSSKPVYGWPSLSRPCRWAPDLGLGQPVEHIMRQCRMGPRMPDLLNLSRDERVVLHYSGLLAWVCCYVDAFEPARWLGDGIQSRPLYVAVAGIAHDRQWFSSKHERMLWMR